MERTPQLRQLTDSADFTIPADGACIFTLATMDGSEGIPQIKDSDS